jgi:transcription termination factor Rho
MKQPSVIDVATSKISEVVSVRTPKVYEIKTRDEVFATLTIYKNLFKLGDDVIGKIHFPGGNVTCLQLLVRVETVELNLSGERKEEHVWSHFTENYVTPFTRECHFKAALPLNAVPSFTTDLGELHPIQRG